MTTRSATYNAKALEAFLTTKFQIDAMLERLKALSDDHFEIPYWGLARITTVVN